MYRTYQNKKELFILFIIFILLTSIVISSKYYSNYLIESQNKLLNRLYNHPLKVSNAALSVQLNIYKMHRDMKDVVLFPTPKELNLHIQNVSLLEKEVEKNFYIIENNILGNKGKKLTQNTFTLFKKWKEIREEVIQLAKKERFQEAIFITQQKGAIHVKNMDESADKLYKYAQKKALEFKTQSNEIFLSQKNFNFILIIIILCIFFTIAYYAIHRLKVYMTKNEKLKKELKDKSEQFEKIFQESPNPIMIHLENGKVYKINKAWEKYSGYSFEDINTIKKWTTKAYKNEAQEKINKNKDENIFCINTKNNHHIYWKLSSAPLSTIEGSQATISSAMDITEIKKKDEMIIAQSRSAAMGDMISMIAHQWRQPLSVVSMIANNIIVDVQLEKIDKDELMKYSRNLLDTSAHLSETINDFSNFFKPEKRKENLKINDILNNSLKFLTKSFEQNEITCTIESSVETHIPVFSRELMQVFMSILINAKEAMIERDDISRIIKINQRESDEEFFITFFNNGTHIKEEHQHKIFEPYFSTKEKKNGTGLGLYISKIIIEEHLNGRISIQNENLGVLVEISLPKKDDK